MLFSVGKHPLWDPKNDTKKDFKKKLLEPIWEFP